MVVLKQQLLNESEFPFPSQHLERGNMFWLHCNGCYIQPESGVVLRFYITNCSHIYCEKCVNECTKECCKVCRSQCTTLELNGKVQKEVENLFDEPINIFQRAVKQVSQSVEFQKSHQKRWCRHLKEVVKRQTEQMKSVKKMVAQYRCLEKETMELKKENSYLKCLLAKNNPGMRAASRGGPYAPRGSPVQSAQSFFGRSPQQQSMSLNQQMNSGGSSSSILNRPGRILMRTPPSGGQLGTTRSRSSYMTPNSVEILSKSSFTPLSVPRPILLSQND